MSFQNASQTTFKLRVDNPPNATASRVANVSYTDMIEGASATAGQNGASVAPGGLQELIIHSLTSGWRRFEGQVIYDDGQGGVSLVLFHVVLWADRRCDITGGVIPTS